MSDNRAKDPNKFVSTAHQMAADLNAPHMKEWKDKQQTSPADQEEIDEIARRGLVNRTIAEMIVNTIG